MIITEVTFWMKHNCHIFPPNTVTCVLLHISSNIFLQKFPYKIIIVLSWFRSINIIFVIHYYANLTYMVFIVTIGHNCLVFNYGSKYIASGTCYFIL